jgi:division protein CdvB (Snf7/Vps24/ESCRT-III family)
MIKLFKPPPQMGDVIFQAAGKLKFQKVKLEHATIRLHERDRTLFGMCVSEIKMKRMEKAAICANELAEVRKIINIVIQCQLALERIILRLETIKEVSQIMTDLKPALKGLHSLVEPLENMMPNVAQELQRVNDSINETMAITSMGSYDATMPIANKTEAGEEILKEVSSFLEKRIAEQLPEPPTPVIKEKREIRENVKKQMIALTATCSEVSQSIEDEDKNKTYFSYKDVEFGRVAFTIQQQSSLEDAILQYAKKSKGKFDIDQCAHQLSASKDEVEKALESLGQKRKIMIQR